MLITVSISLPINIFIYIHICTNMLLLIYIYIHIWSSYSDLTRPHPKWWFSKRNPLISGKSMLVKYYPLARYIIYLTSQILFGCSKVVCPLLFVLLLRGSLTVFPALVDSLFQHLLLFPPHIPMVWSEKHLHPMPPPALQTSCFLVQKRPLKTFSGCFARILPL